MSSRLAALALVLALAPMGCRSYRQSFTLSHQFTHTTDEELRTIPIDEAVRSFLVDLEVRLRAGTLEFSITDPGGEVVCREVLEAPLHTHLEADLPLRLGPWTTRVAILEATGFYSVQVEATD